MGRTHGESHSRGGYICPGPRDVVRTVVYVTDMGDMHEVARAHRERFAGIMPASTIVQVAALGGPSLCIEIEAYAIVAESCGAW